MPSPPVTHLVASLFASTVLLAGCTCGLQRSGGDARSDEASHREAKDVGHRAGLKVHVVGEGEGPIVVLLHGYGAPGDDLVPLARSLDVPDGTRFFLPEAMLDLGGGGRAWWPLDLTEIHRMRASGEMRDLSKNVPRGLPEARERIRALLDEIVEREGVSRASILLGGFSQGAMLACDVALHEETSLGGLILLSGTLVAEEQWEPRMKRHARMPVLLSHGRQDELLPFPMAERLRDRLQGAGLDVRFVAFDGGHAIPSIVRIGMMRFIREHGPQRGRR